MDRELLSQLYSRYANQLYRYLFSICKNAALAEDLLQDTFLKALLSLDDSHPNFRAWLYMVGRNLCLNRLKSDRRLAPLKTDAPSGGGLPEAVEQRQADAMLYATVLRLPQRQRQAIVLEYFCGLTQQQAAQVLGVSHQNLRVILHRGKKELKTLLEVTQDEI